MVNQKIEEIEGIGPAYAEKLLEAGIKTTDDMLEHGRAPKGREEIATKTGISSTLILKWVNMADLFRVNGVGGEFAELLEAAGVDTVKELKHRNPENLAEKMAEVNETKKLTRVVPSAKTVEKWVEEAKTMPAGIEY